VINDVSRGEIDLLRIFFIIEIYSGDTVEFLKYFLRRQFRNFIGLLFSDRGDEIDIIVYVTVFSVIYSVFRRS
jgi:hypothetical protein